MPQHPNVLQRRSDLLAAAIQDRVSTTYKALTEPEPAFRVKKPEADQVREYMGLVQSGGLRAMRQSSGGNYPDEDVDRYSAAMERLIPKYASDLYGAVPAPQQDV